MQSKSRLKKQKSSGIPDINIDALIKINEDNDLGINGGRNLSVIGGKEEFIKKNASNNSIINIDISQIDENSVLINSNSDTPLSASSVINKLNSTPEPPRIKRNLSISAGTEPEDVDKIIKKARETIEKRNEEEGRADILNIIRVPTEEFQRLAIMGEVEKIVNKRLKTEYNFDGKIDKLSNLFPEMIQSTKCFETNGKYNAECNALNDLFAPIEVENPHFKRGKEKRLLKKRKGLTEKQAKKQLDRMSKLQIENWTIAFNNPTTDIGGLDKNKLEIIIDEEFDLNGKTYKLNEPINFFTVPSTDIEKEISNIKQPEIYKNELSKVANNLNKNLEILNIFKQNQPNTPSEMFPTDQEFKEGYGKKEGEYTSKMGTNVPAPPKFPKTLQEKLNESLKDGIGFDTDDITSYAEWLVDTKNFNKKLLNMETNRCPAGSVQVEKINSNSMGMTPPQQRCGIAYETEMVQGKIQHKRDKDGNKIPIKSSDPRNLPEYDEFSGAVNILRRNQLWNSPDENREDLLENEFGKIVACYDDKEVEYVKKIEKNANSLDKLDKKILNVNGKELTQKELQDIVNEGIEEFKKIGISEKDLNEYRLKKDVKDAHELLLATSFKEEDIAKKIDKATDINGNNPINKLYKDVDITDTKALKKLYKQNNQRMKKIDKIKKKLNKKSVYKVPILFPVQSTSGGNISYCKSLKNAKPNMVIETTGSILNPEFKINYKTKKSNKKSLIINPK